MKGIRETKTARQAFFKFRGRFVSQCFPKGTADRVLTEWIEDTRVALRTGAIVPTLDTGPTFADDVRTYLRLRTSMPTYDTRARHLHEWADYFGHRPRSSITPHMIRARLEQLRAGGAAPGTVNRVRTALMSLWTVLDGKSARNPVRDAPKYREPAGEPRALSYMTIYRILVCMRPSKTRTRLRVLAWTGWPQKQIGGLAPAHLALDVDKLEGRAYVTPRRKGGGTRGTWLPLLPGAVLALDAFRKEDCFGTFSASSMRHAFRLGLAKLNAHRARLKLRPIEARPYDLRHSFGTMLALKTHDERVVQTMMLHATAEQTRRYTEAATTPRVDAAIRGLHLQPLPAVDRGQPLSNEPRKASNA